MIKYLQPVRRNVPQRIVYTFQDQAGAIIDLTSYVSATVETKLMGGTSSSTVAVIQSPATGGVALIAAYTFATVGFWYVQFVCTDGSGNKLYGEPLSITVVANVDDLGTNDILGE